MKKILLVALFASACSPALTAQSFAPPGRAARLDEVTGFWGTVKSYKLELSQGVALAFTCNYGGPCKNLTATSDDPRIAEIRPSALGILERSGLQSQAPASAAVVVGKMPGVTHLHVHRTKAIATSR